MIHMKGLDDKPVRRPAFDKSRQPPISAEGGRRPTAFRYVVVQSKQIGMAKILTHTLRIMVILWTEPVLLARKRKAVSTVPVHAGQLCRRNLRKNSS